MTDRDFNENGKYIWCYFPVELVKLYSYFRMLDGFIIVSLEKNLAVENIRLA